MTKLDVIRSKVLILNSEIEEAIKEAYNNGYLDGISTEKPSQDEFDKQHQEVRAYGEEGNLLVLAGGLNHESAEKKYKQYLTKELGWFDDELNQLENMKMSNVSYELHEGEPSFYIRADRGGIYDCWLLELDV